MIKMQLIKKYIDKLIDETVQQTVEENVFKRVMEYDEFKEDDNDIHKIGVENKDFHTINKKTYKFEIDYDPNEGDGEYSSRLSIDLVFLPYGNYTMVFEMYFDDGLNVEQLNATAATLIINKQILTTNKTNIKNIIQCTKSIKTNPQLK